MLRRWRRDVDVDRRCGNRSTPTAQITHLTNGVQYVCRAYAANAVGLSEPSALSDAAMPCGSFVDCDPLLRSLVQPILVLLGVLLAGGLLAAFVALYRERPRGYVVAVVDVVHSANLGHGSRLGFDFVRDPVTRTITGIAPARGGKADIRIRQRRGGRFEVTIAGAATPRRTANRWWRSTRMADDTSSSCGHSRRMPRRRRGDPSFDGWVGRSSPVRSESRNTRGSCPRSRPR